MPDTTPEPSYEDILDSAASEYAVGAINEQLAGTIEQPPPPPKVEAPVEEEAPPVEPPKPAVTTTSAELKLMRREAELRKREDAVKAALSQLKVEPPKVTETPKAINPKLDPAGYLKSLGLDPAEVARVMLAQALGDKVPQEYQDRANKFTEKAQLDDRLEQLQAKIDRFEQAEAQKAAQARAQTEFQKTVKDAKPTPSQPLASDLFKTNPGYFAEEVTREIYDDAKTRYFTEGASAQAITAEEAITRIEKRLKAYGFKPSATVIDAPKTNVRAALQNRSNKHIDDTESFDDIEAQALKSFLAASQG